MAEHGSTLNRKSSTLAFLGLLTAAIMFAVTTTLVTSACGGSEESGYFIESRDDSSMADSRDGRSVATPVMVVKEVEVMKEVMKEVVVESERATEAMEMEGAMAAKAMVVDDFGESVDVSFQPQTRIIVRNADMVVQSNDPASAVDVIGDLAVQRGGWVVNSNASDYGFYNITIRVPAGTLDAVIEQVSALATKVESVTSDSTDFTEEYIDLGARRTTVQETVDALTELLKSENYDSVEELLEVQREITNWQSELEIIDGRMSFISESAAFSRLSVTVNRSPIPMRVDVGEDIHIGIGVGRKFTARIYSPDGYDRFEVTWDFGDGSPQETINSALRTQNEEGFLSVPVRHIYFSDEFAPHVVTASVRAYSDRGLAEGEDSQWVQVSELPSFDAFVSASENDVQEGRPVTLAASFNHPDTVRNVEYEWDIRDGSKFKTGVVLAGETNVELEHIFARYRPDSYQVVFKITGDSDAGEVEEIREAYIYVYPAPAVDSADFEPAGTATNAVNVLIAVFTFAGTAGIWLAITSPIWLIVGAIIFFLVRFLIRRQRNVQRVVYVPNVDAGTREAVDEQTSSTEEKDA